MINILNVFKSIIINYREWHVLALTLCLYIPVYRLINARIFIFIHHTEIPFSIPRCGQMSSIIIFPFITRRVYIVSMGKISACPSLFCTDKGLSIKLYWVNASLYNNVAGMRYIIPKQRKTLSDLTISEFIS